MVSGKALYYMMVVLEMITKFPENNYSKYALLTYSKYTDYVCTHFTLACDAMSADIVDTCNTGLLDIILNQIQRGCQGQQKDFDEYFSVFTQYFPIHQPIHHSFYDTEMCDEDSSIVFRTVDELKKNLGNIGIVVSSVPNPKVENYLQQIVREEIHIPTAKLFNYVEQKNLKAMNKLAGFLHELFPVFNIPIEIWEKIADYTLDTKYKMYGIRTVASVLCLTRDKALGLAE